jgi:hypothetical protein
MDFTNDLRMIMRIPYALRRVPEAKFAQLLPPPKSPAAGDLVLVRLEKIGKNARLELPTGRPCALHVGDVLALVFGNRYATNQFEGYARVNGDSCDMLSMGGLCGLVESRHAGIPAPSQLRILGALADENGRQLNLRDFALPRLQTPKKFPHVIVVVGTSMDSGKTYTAMSIIVGLRLQGMHVAGIKVTGTATGRDTWSMRDAGASPALDFIDGGFGSTYMCSLSELKDLYSRLVAHASSMCAEWVVIEIADGLLQRETSAMLQDAEFRKTVHSWIFAAGDSMAAESGVRLLRKWGIEPKAVSGVLSMSPLGIREAAEATGVPCFTAEELQQGVLNSVLVKPVNTGCLIDKLDPAQVAA